MALWKEIKGYEGMYLLSDEGEIISLSRTVRRKNRAGSFVGVLKSKRLKTCLRGRNGNMYEAVTLTKDGISKRYSVHRLVAETFIPNPNELPKINHKDENRLNNRADNLEWCTRQYNIDYSKSKPVNQIKDGKVVGQFKSIAYASAETGISRRSINNALRGWSRSAGGFQWAYCE